MRLFIYILLIVNLLTLLFLQIYDLINRIKFNKIIKKYYDKKLQ